MSTAYLNLARPFERALASATRVSMHSSATVSTLALNDMQLAGMWVCSAGLLLPMYLPDCGGCANVRRVSWFLQAAG